MCDYCDDPAVDHQRQDFVSALAALPRNEQDAVQKVIDERWPVCIGTWDAQGEKQSYTCLMGAAALAATQHVWSEIPALCRDMDGLESLVSENLSYEAHEVVPGAFDEFFYAPGHKDRYTREAVGTGGNVRILNAAGRAALQECLTEARVRL